MLQVGSALKGYGIQATDGVIGTVSDLLFDDKSWKLRWVVVNTGNWLTGRLVLVHPSAIVNTDTNRRMLSVALTKARIEASPSSVSNQPVSRQMEDNLYNYYGWDPVWGSSFFGPDATLPDVAAGSATDTATLSRREGEDKDPHLRSLSTVTGYHIQASDGALGHVEDVLLEDSIWGIRYLIVDTRNWWPGQHVLVSPYAVREISWSKEQVLLNVTRQQVKDSPPWAPLEIIDQAYEKRLHQYYDWPGYGW